MADHVLCDDDVVVDLAVVDLELEADEVGKDGGGPGLCANRADSLAWEGTGYGKTVVLFCSWLGIIGDFLVLRDEWGCEVWFVREGRKRMDGWMDSYGTM